MTSKIQVSFGRAGHILNISFKTIWPHLGQSYEAGWNVGHVDHMDQVDPSGSMALHFGQDMPRI